MKKLICLYSVAFHNSLLGQLFVFDTPGGEEEKRETPPPVETDSQPSFKEYLKQLEKSKDNPEKMAATLEATLLQLETEYAGKGQDRIEDGRRRLVDMCKALDVTGGEKTIILADYESTFKGTETTQTTIENTLLWFDTTRTETTEYNAKDREMKEASDKDVADHLTALKDSAYQELAKYDPLLKATDERYTEAETNIGLCDTAIAAAEEQETETLLSVQDAETTLEEMGRRMGLDVTTPEDLEQYLKNDSKDHKLSTLLKKGMFKKDPIEAADDEHLGTLNNKIVARLAHLEQGVDAVRAAKEAHEAAQEHTQDLEEDRASWQENLDTAAAEHQTTYEEYAAKKKQIEDGTYKLNDGKETIQHQAEREASNSVSPDEQAVIDKYAKLVAEKTTVLMRRAAFKKLEAVEQSLEEKIVKTETAIEKKQVALQENTKKAFTALDTWETGRGITNESTTALYQKSFGTSEWTTEAHTVVKPLVAAKYADRTEDFMPGEDGEAERQEYLTQRENAWVAQYEAQMKTYYDVKGQEKKDANLVALQGDLSSQQSALAKVSSLKGKYATA